MSDLHDLLETGLRYHPTYLPSNNSDHLPMTLCAIHGLGGDLAEFGDYRASYIRRLHEFESQPPPAVPEAGFGRIEAYPGLLSYFRLAVRDNGSQATIERHLHALLPGMALEAFHPLIRLAYAVDFECDAEVAAALAYLAASTREFPVDTSTCIDLGEALQRQVDAGPETFSTPRFSQSLLELEARGGYPTGRAKSIEACAAAALDVYRATRNFFALHMVTASQAVRICSRFVDESFALACLTGALLAAHKVVGSPGFRGVESPPPVELDTEHAYKYVWVCLSEFRHSGDARYADEIRAFRNAGLVPEWCAPEVD